MSADLVFYKVDDETGTKEMLNDAVSFGNIFKGTVGKVAVTIFNAGDTAAVSPKATIRQYPTGNYNESYKWKQVSMSENAGYANSIELPDIPAGGWLPGQDIIEEDFNNYPVIAGTKPDQSWMLWMGSSTAWEVYNGWLQHNIDTQDGRALWTELFQAKDFTFEIKFTVRDGVYSGLILRDEGDSNTGYIMLIQAMPGYLGEVQSNEGVIQIFDGKFTDGIENWELLYTSGTIGVRGTHDPFKLRLTDNKFEFWYGNTSGSPRYVWVDEERRHMKAARPVICTHAGFGSVLIYFDDIKMTITNEDGRIWIQNTVPSNTPVYSTQRTILDITYGSE